MATPDHTMTLIQFHAVMREEFYRRSPDATASRAKYDRLYPPSCRYGDWYDAIEDAVKSGYTIRREVCDDLYRRAPLAWKHLVHDWGAGWLPTGYFNPDVRQQQRAAR